MIKNIWYDGKWLPSAELEGVPHAFMQELLSHIIPGSWPDYEQVLNSSEDMIFDLDIKLVEGVWLIPVTSVGHWLYSFSLKTMRGELYDRFRIFRRDVEKSYRVAWALEVENLFVKPRGVAYEGFYTDRFSAWDIANIFSNYDVPEVELEGGDDNVRSVLDYVNYIAGGTAAGPRGNLLSETIEYVESMPFGDEICEHINDLLVSYLPEEEQYLDDYLDTLNAFISGEATRFVGEL